MAPRDFEGGPFIPALDGRRWASIYGFVVDGPIGGTAKVLIGLARFPGFAKAIVAR